MKTLDLPFEAVKAPIVYRFLWNAKKGPVLRTFASPHHFDAYVREIKTLAPEVSLTWINPLVAVACFP